MPEIASQTGGSWQPRPVLLGFWPLPTLGVMPMTCLVPAQADHSSEAVLAKSEPPWLGWFQSTCVLEQTLWETSQMLKGLHREGQGDMCRG